MMIIIIITTTIIIIIIEKRKEKKSIFVVRMLTSGSCDTGSNHISGLIFAFGFCCPNQCPTTDIFKAIVYVVRILKIFS